MDPASQNKKSKSAFNFDAWEQRDNKKFDPKTYDSELQAKQQKKVNETLDMKLNKEKILKDKENQSKRALNKSYEASIDVAQVNFLIFFNVGFVFLDFLFLELLSTHNLYTNKKPSWVL